MVATILSLRWTATIHQLRREWWRMLVLIGAGIWTISLLPTVAWTARELSFRPADVKMDAYTAIVAVLIIGWVVVPILVAGLDDTLDPSRFSSLGIGSRRIMPGLTVSSFLTIPSLFFLTTMVLYATSWVPDGDGVFAVALIGSLLSLATMILSARVSVMWVSRLLQSRRSREFAFLVFLIGLFVAAPLASILLAGGLETVLEYDLRPVLEALRLTPIGAPIGAAGEAAFDHWEGVWWRLGFSGAWVVMLWLVWKVNVAHVLVHPISRGGGARAREDSVLATAYRVERRRMSRRPPRAVTAVRTRAIRYWLSDPRYLAAILSVAVFPILFFFLVYPVFGSPLAVILAVPVLLAGTIGWGRHNDVAFDSTALWLDVVAGSLGRAVMWGRTTATLTWALPIVAACVVVAIFVGGRADLAPGAIGATLGVLGTSLGVSAVTSVVLPYRAPVPGENPFSAQVGSVGAGLLAQAISSAVAWIVAVPVVLPLVAALMWDPAWGWVGLITGSATGSLVLLFGVRWAGDLYDRKSGRLVGAVS